MYWIYITVSKVPVTEIDITLCVLKKNGFLQNDNARQESLEVDTHVSYTIKQATRRLRWLGWQSVIYLEQAIDDFCLTEGLSVPNEILVCKVYNFVKRLKCNLNNRSLKYSLKNCSRLCCRLRSCKNFVFTNIYGKQVWVVVLYKFESR